ncbi:MAG: hypothetical protein ACE5HZ_06880 [Fidelibacterota bacterium]
MSSNIYWSNRCNLSSIKTPLAFIPAMGPHEALLDPDWGDQTVLDRNQMKEIESAAAVSIGCFVHRRMPNDSQIQKMRVENL